jgi:ornithine carbamoyltransferase
MDVRIGAPRDLWPPDDVVAIAHQLAAGSGARLLVTEDVAEAVLGVDFVYTGAWVGTGESPEVWAKRVPMLTPYQVNEAVMAGTGNPQVKLLHCLPALHDRSTVLGERLWTEHGLDGAEVTSAVFTSGASLVFTQAENRLHTIKALMLHALTGA